MKHRNLVLRQLQKGNAIQDITKKIMAVLSNGRWKLVKDVLEEAKIDSKDSLVFSALVYLQNQNLAEIDGGIPIDQNFTFETIRLTERGMFHIQDYMKKNVQEDV